MTARTRCLYSLVMLLTLLGMCRGADEGLSRLEIAKTGKAATALVVVKDRGTGSAFCIHASGLFLTNEHVAQGELSIVLNPGHKTEKTYPARVIRSDKELDLALLRVENVKSFPALTLGSDENLQELMEVVTLGFPFGDALAPGKHEYPAVSINPGYITSLRHKEGRLHRIQLDAALNPGNSGGPVLDKNGKVVGVVVAGVRGSGVNFAIPVSTVTRFVARPDIQFEPPLLVPGSFHNPVRFEARVKPILPSKVPLTVDLILTSKDGEQTHRMQADGDTYRVTAVPVPPPPGPFTMPLRAQFDDGVLNATAADQGFKAADQEVKLREVRGIRLEPRPRVVLHDGKRINGQVTGLAAVPMQLGGQTLSVNLAKATEVTFMPAIDSVSCTLVVRQRGEEILQHSQALTDPGFLKNPGFEAGPEGWSHNIAGTPARFEFDPNVANEGWQALRMSATEPCSTAFWQEILLKPGHWYRFSGWVRTRGLDPRGAPACGTFIIQPPGGTGAYAQNIASGTNHQGDTEWTEVPITFQAPASGLTRICGVFVGFGQGTGTAWFDDLKLVEVGQDSRTKIARWAAPGLGVTDGLELWLDAAQLNAARQAHGLDALKSGDAVETWFDASGHGRNVRQRTAASRPQLVRVGNDWLVRFNGTDNHLRFTGQNRWLSGCTVFVVVAPRANPGGFRGILAANEPRRRDHQTGFNIDLGGGGTGQFERLNVEGRGFEGEHNLLDRAVPFGALHILELSVDPDRRIVRVILDGRRCGERPCAPAPLSFDEVTVGARYFNEGPAPVYAQHTFPGDIAEILVYDRPRTEQERRSVREYLRRKYDPLNKIMRTR